MAKFSKKPFNKFDKAMAPDPISHDESAVGQLFLLAEKGDFEALIRFTRDNNVSINSVNADGETILYTIINNGDMDDIEKSRIIQRLVSEIGLNPNSTNNKDSTPLHHAAKQQLVNTTRVLLDNQVERNKSDYRQKTALHYALNPEEVKCSTRPDDNMTLMDQKLKEIDEPGFESPEKSLDEMAEKIIDGLNSDDNTKKIIKHIKSVLLEPNVHHTKDIDTLVKGLKDDIQTAYQADPTLSKEHFKEMTRANKKKIKEIIQSRLGIAINKIGDYDEINEIKITEILSEMMRGSLKKKKEELVEQLEKITENVKNELESAKNSHENIENGYVNLIQAINTSHKILGNQNVKKGTQLGNVKTQASIDSQKTRLDFEINNLEAKKDAIEADMVTMNMVIAHKNAVDAAGVAGVAPPPIPIHNGTPLPPPHTNQLKIFRKKEKELADINKKLSDADKQLADIKNNVDITNEFANNIQSITDMMDFLTDIKDKIETNPLFQADDNVVYDFSILLPVADLTIDFTPHVTLRDINDSGIHDAPTKKYEGDGLIPTVFDIDPVNKPNIFTLMNYHIEQCNSNLRDIKNKVSNILDNEIDNDPRSAIRELSMVHMDVLTLCTQLIHLNKYMETYEKGVLHIMTVVHNSNTDVPNQKIFRSYQAGQSPPKIRQFNTSKTLERYVNFFIDGKEKLVPKISGKISDAFSKVVNISGFINNVIGYVNDRYSKKYTKFMIDKIKFPNNVLRDILVQNIPMVESMSDGMNDYPVDETVDYIKIHMMDKYMYKSTCKVSPNFTIMTNNPVSQPNVGFIGLDLLPVLPAGWDAQFGSMDLDLTPEKNSHRMSIHTSNPLHIVTYGSNNNGKGSVMNIPNTIASDKIDSGKLILPIVQSNLDNHIKLLKIILMFNAFRKYSTWIDRETIDKIYNKAKEVIPDIDRDVLIKGIVGRVIDKQMSAFINNCVSLASDNLLKFVYNDYNVASFNADLDTGIERVPMVMSISDLKKKVLHNIIDDVGRLTDNDDRLIDHMGKQFDDFTVKHEHRVFDIMGENAKCYMIDQDLVKMLVDARCDVNARDNNGDTALHGLLDIKHTDCVDLLLDAKASVHSRQSTNSKNLTPLTKSLVKLSDYYKLFNVDKMIDSINGHIGKDMIAESDYWKVVSDGKLILKMTLYLTNQQLKEYIGLIPEYDELLTILGVNTTGIPLVDNLTTSVPQFHNDGYERISDDVAIKIVKLTTDIETASVQKDLNERRLNMASGNEQQRITVVIDNLNNLIDRYTTEIASLQTNTTAINSKIKKHTDNLPDNLADIDFTGVYNGTSSDIANIYAKIFNKFIQHSGGNEDYRVDLNSYRTLWSKLIKNNPSDTNNDETQLVRVAIESLRDVEGSKVEAINVICKYINSAKKCVKDYFDLDRHYKRHNYMLNSMVKIYAHVIRHTLCTDYYNILMETVLTHINANDAGTTETKLNKCKAIFSGDMFKYMMNVVPKSAVKNVLEIHTREDDPDRTTDPEILLGETVKILADNTIYPMNIDGELLMNIKNNLVPYFGKCFQKYITGMELITERYMRTILNATIDVDIYNKLYNQYLHEIRVR